MTQTPSITVPLLVAAAAVLVFTGMDALVKGLPGELPVMQIVAMRFAFGLPPALLVGWWLRTPWPSAAAWRGNGLRGVLVLLSTAQFFFAVRTLPFAEALALSFLAPLFIATLSALLLGERMGLGLLGAVLIGLGGVAVILAGGVMEAAPDASLLGAAAALGSAVTYAGSMVMLRRQAQRDPAITIVLVMQVVPLAIAMPFAASAWVAPSAGIWALFVLIGMIGVGGHMCLTWAYARAPAGRLGVIDYTALPYAAILGFVVFGEVPGLPVWLGGALIVVACLWVSRLRG